MIINLINLFRPIIITTIVILIIFLLSGCCSKDISMTKCPPIQKASLSDVGTLMEDYDTLFNIYEECAGLK